MSLQVFDERRPLAGYAMFEDDSWSDPQYLVIGDLDPQRWDALWAVNDDSIQHTVIMGIGATGENRLATAVVPAGAGNGTIPPTDLLACQVAALQAGIALPIGRTLFFVVGEAINTDKTVQVVGLGGAL